MKRLLLVTISCLFLSSSLKADEGMWLPMLVERLNYVDMQKEGLQLTAEELYSINSSSLKDAIVRLGPGFCTGEMISDQGLMLTNHHCGYDAIQSLSSEKDNYLDNGFWAMNKQEEKQAGFSVSFLLRMEDVSSQICAELNEDMSPEERTKKIHELSDEIQKNAVGETSNTAEVKIFYNGNEFYLFVYENFEDVRLVGAPPESIGKFGGDTDNWMWPRHTGDFSIFRIYANEKNEPAPYSENNVPYKPRHYLPISLKGVGQGDFSMVYGYPGSTNRYLSSAGIKYELDIRQPTYVKLRRIALDIYEEEMKKNDGIRLKYSSKHAGISNYWKYFKGQSEGLKRLEVYERKKASELVMADWIRMDQERNKTYDSVLDGFDEGYANLNEVKKIGLYINEAIFRIEAISYAYNFTGFKRALVENNNENLEKEREDLLKNLDENFKDYDKVIDQKIFAAMIEAYSKDIPIKDQASEFKKIVANYRNDFDKMAASVYSKTLFADKEKIRSMINSPNLKKIEKDPIY
ncbi:MAG: S46 family peptidase, partial [Cyclobacteriaceae bacterium]|nr:S46 family peptidase [Cyclobacteriaceae bacterium]